MAACNSKTAKQDNGLDKAQARVGHALYRKEPPRKSGGRYEAGLINLTRKIHDEEGRLAVYLIAERLAVA
jgi:hypothetical protein